MTFNLNKSLFISLLLLFWPCFSCQKKKPMTPNSQKAIFYSLLTENYNLKQETIFVLFANCDHWISSLETPVEKYVHFQAFTSCLILQNSHLSNVKQKKKQWTIKLIVNQILQTYFNIREYFLLFLLWLFRKKIQS